MASLHCMPILMVNLGAEMIYVLNQRLQAQDLSPAKIKRVLSDVLITMYNPVFVEEFFKPVHMYSNQACCKIFERLAHSSIMRLNEISMGKLYDLMSMAFKYQLQNCVDPKQIIQVTLNHIDAITALGNEAAENLISNTRSQLLAHYGEFSMGEFLFLRQTLFRFFQDRHVKLSIFLQDEVQRTDGHMVLNMSGKTANPNHLGEVQTLNPNGSVAETWNIKLKVLEVFSTEPGPPGYTTLGANMYLKNRSNPAKGESKVAESSAESKRRDSSANAADELDYLASMIATESSPQAFKLSLDWGVIGGADDGFKDSSAADSENGLLVVMPEPGRKNDDEVIAVLDIDGNNERKTYAERIADLGFDEQPKRSAGVSKEQDLLDLLDDDEEEEVSDEDSFERFTRIEQGSSKLND